MAPQPVSPVNSISPQLQNTPDPPVAIRCHVHERNPVKYDGVTSVRSTVTLMTYMRAVILQRVGRSGHNSAKVLDLAQEAFVERLEAGMRFDDVHGNQLPEAEPRLVPDGKACTQRCFHGPVNAGDNPRSHLISSSRVPAWAGTDVELHEGDVQRPPPAGELPAKGHGFKEGDKNEVPHNAILAAGIGQWGRTWD